MTYSYQYNIKITGVPQVSDRETSEEKANICLKIFAGIGVGILISGIDIAHRVQTRNSNRGQRHQPIICKFVRRMTRDKVMAARNNTNQLSADDLGLPSSTEIGRITIFAYRGAKVFNNIPKNIRETETLNALKKRIFKYLFTS